MSDSPFDIYKTEEQIKCELKPLFDEELMFTQFTMDDLESDLFKEIDEQEAQCACLILYSGFTVKDTAVRGVSQIINPQWRVVTVTPSELYKTHASVKMMQVMKALKGLKLDGGQRTLRLVNDVREFHEPAFVNQLVGLPSVYSFDVVV